MAKDTVRSAQVAKSAPKPIEMIARAELARSARSQEIRPADSVPDHVPPSRLYRQQGLSGVLDAALGAVELPTLLELQSALGAAQNRLAAGAQAQTPLAELDTVVSAVLAEEQDKIARYLRVRDA